MLTATLTKTDPLVRDAVILQLEWDSEFDASCIGVTVHDGVVTLTGFIDSYAGKLAAERAAKRVRGVRVVANDVQVRLRLDHPDPEIAADIAAVLRSRPAIPATVQVVVHNGHASVTGAVPTLFVRAMTVNAIRTVRGLKGVVNHLEVVPATTVRDLRRRIVRALHQNAEVDARELMITLTGNTVTLTGEVESWAEAEAAEQAVMHAPGVIAVDNRITVAPHLVPIPESEAEIC